MNNPKKTTLAVALAAAIGISTSTSADTVIEASYAGWFTLLNAAGTGALVNDDATTQGMYGRRTVVTGTMSFNLDTGAGSGAMESFEFFGRGLSTVTNISLQAIGDGTGSSGPLILGNMGLNFGGTTQIPISIVLDASGFFGAVAGGLTTSDIITGGSFAATEDFAFDFGNLGSYTLPMGAAPIVTTAWNTTDVGTVTLGSNPSGTLPLTDDGIGGSPMKVGPFPGFNANFDFTELHVMSVTSTVPIPAALWLFGSGLLGLVGISRRKKTS